MNIREKICIQMGSLLLENMEVSDQLEQALANTSRKDAKIAELQAAVDAAAKVASDTNVAERDAPSGATAPPEAPSAA